MLTAKDLLQDKIEGFEAGADDYLVKPFSLAELDVRLKRCSVAANVATSPTPADRRRSRRSIWIHWKPNVAANE